LSAELKKDVGLPNLYPYKQKLLDDLERKKNAETHETATNLKREKPMNDNFEMMIAQAKHKVVIFEEEQAKATHDKEVDQDFDRGRIFFTRAKQKSIFQTSQ
jgi:GNL3L/Grn1 putative GTPase